MALFGFSKSISPQPRHKSLREISDMVPDCGDTIILVTNGLCYRWRGGWQSLLPEMSLECLLDSSAVIVYLQKPFYSTALLGSPSSP